jgi:hypothetical protein
MVRFDGVSATEDKAARPPWNAEILLSLLPNTAKCLMISSSPHGTFDAFRDVVPPRAGLQSS